jgi:hypothetical protein
VTVVIRFERWKMKGIDDIYIVGRRMYLPLHLLLLLLLFANGGLGGGIYSASSRSGYQQPFLASPKSTKRPGIDADWPKVTGRGREIWSKR